MVEPPVEPIGGQVSHSRRRRVRVKPPVLGGRPIVYRDWTLTLVGLVSLVIGAWEAISSVVDLPEWTNRPPLLWDRYWAAGFVAFFLLVGSLTLPLNLRIYADKVIVRNLLVTWEIPIERISEVAESRFGDVVLITDSGRRVHSHATLGSLGGTLTGGDDLRAERIESTIEVLQARAVEGSGAPGSSNISRRFRPGLLLGVAGMVAYGIFAWVAHVLDVGG